MSVRLNEVIMAEVGHTATVLKPDVAHCTGASCPKKDNGITTLMEAIVSENEEAMKELSK